MVITEVCTSRDGKSEIKEVMFQCPICKEFHDELEEAKECLVDCYQEEYEEISEVIFDRDQDEDYYR